MNKFIKMPLFLGVTCLVAGGMLAGVSALTDPVIAAAKLEREAKAYIVMYNDENVKLHDQITVDSATAEATGIQTISKVEHKDGISIVYKMKSKSKYETLLFNVGIDQDAGAVDSYCFLEKVNSTSDLGTNVFNQDDKVNELYQGYTGGDKLIFSGVTFTSDGVRAAINNALADFNENRKGW